MLNHNDYLQVENDNLKSHIEELEQTITDLNTIISNLQIEKEELQKQIKYWKDGHDMIKEDYDMYRNILYNGAL